ncbi:alpha/beta fold hydrolase [Actinomadura oligospora]|uniref:alpha/beta fold hydrolase n=1 Tax=Actinomadura oligospora TaxID=111804 RepID=UPI0004B97C18|nr:alpha/beta hydrolase [Actinomadura oligospora]
MTATTTPGMPDVPGVDHRFVDLPQRGVRLHVAEAGPRDGEPVLLLHGFPQHWYAWRHVIPQLAVDHRVIAVDLRGFGWSDAPRDGYTGGGLARDVIALLDALDLDRVRVIGHDWGAWVGFILAIESPERVSRFVAVNMTHPWPEHLKLMPNLWRMWHTALLEYPPIGRLVLRGRRFVRFLLRHWAADATLWKREDLDVYADVFRDPARARAGEQFHFQYVVHEILRHPRGRYRRARLTVPTLILAGERDLVIPPSVVGDGTSHADDLRVKVIEGGGHLLPEERPEAVADEARDFFTQGATPAFSVARGASVASS